MIRVDETPPFIYRGTTHEWAGRKNNQDERMTCASSDPAVATLFAVHCRNFGAAVVHILHTKGHALIRSQHWSAEIESEVFVQLTPAELAAAAVKTLNVDDAIHALQTIGIRLPHRLPPSMFGLTDFLCSEFMRKLGPDEIREFNTLCGVTGHV